MSKLTINENATRFIIYAYLGVDINDEITEDKREKVIEACVRRAYLDMCRTLRTKESWDDRKKGIISDMVIVLKQDIGVEKIKEQLYRIFFDKNGIKTDIIEHLNIIKNTDIYFSYGHAQKWINMTLKYMWLIGLISEDEVCMLDVPIDRLILKRIENKEDFNGKPWSRINSDDYGKICEKIKNTKKKTTVIEWELDAWIAQAKKENKNK